MPVFTLLTYRASLYAKQQATLKSYSTRFPRWERHRAMAAEKCRPGRTPRLRDEEAGSSTRDVADHRDQGPGGPLPAIAYTPHAILPCQQKHRRTDHRDK